MDIVFDRLRIKQIHTDVEASRDKNTNTSFICSTLQFLVKFNMNEMLPLLGSPGKIFVKGFKFFLSIFFLFLWPGGFSSYWILGLCCWPFTYYSSLCKICALYVFKASPILSDFSFCSAQTL